RVPRHGSGRRIQMTISWRHVISTYLDRSNLSESTPSPRTNKAQPYIRPTEAAPRSVQELCSSRWRQELPHKSTPVMGTYQQPARSISHEFQRFKAIDGTEHPGKDILRAT